MRAGVRGKIPWEAGLISVSPHFHRLVLRLSKCAVSQMRTKAQFLQKLEWGSTYKNADRSRGAANQIRTSIYELRHRKNHLENRTAESEWHATYDG